MTPMAIENDPRHAFDLAATFNALRDASARRRDLTPDTAEYVAALEEESRLRESIWADVRGLEQPH